MGRSKWWMKVGRVGTAGILALVIAVAAVGSAHPASALESWCWDDPLLLIDGQIVDLTVGVLGDPAAIRAGVQGAEFRVHVAPGTNASVLLITNTYFPQTVTWVYDGVRNADGSQQVRAEVIFRATASFPTALYVTRLIDGTKLSLTQQMYYGTTLVPTQATFPLAAATAPKPTLMPTPTRATTTAPSATPTPVATPAPKGGKSGKGER